MIQWLMNHSLSASDTEELERRRKLYNLVFNAQIVSLILLTGIVLPSVYHFGWLVVILGFGIPLGTMMGFQFLGRHFVKLGRFNLGVTVTTISIFVTLTFLMMLWGARDRVIFIFIWPVLTATLLIAPRMGFVVAAYGTLLTITLTTLEFVIPNTFPWSPDQLLYYPNWHQGGAFEAVLSVGIDMSVDIVVLFAVAYLCSILSDSLLDAIDDARSKMKALRELTQKNAKIAQRIQTTGAEVEDFVTRQQRGASQASSAVGQIGASLRHLHEASREIDQQSGDVAHNAQRNLTMDSEIVDRISDLRERTTRIDELVNTIAEIGNKSEILALNAALEGVKAGQAGQGFVIVANEMQKLAEDVLGRLPNVTSHVSDIRSATSELMRSTQAGTALTQKTANLTHEISQFTRRQVEGTEQVSTAVDDIERVTQEAVTSTDQLITAMNELTTLASTLAVTKEDESSSELPN